MAGATIGFRARGTGWARPEPGAAAVLALLAALLGGASRNAPVPLVLLEIACLPVGVLAIRRMAADRRAREWVSSLALIGLVLAIPLIQSIPLPPRLWLGAPGQEPRFAARVVSGLDLGWAPLSLNPAETLRAIPALSQCRLIAKGNRLSVLPLTDAEFDAIVAVADRRARSAKL